MRFLFALGLVFLNSCIALAQEKNIVKITSISVYKDFLERGYTTAGAYSHFADMKANSVPKIAINKEDIEKLEGILGRSKKKKHHQRKLGIRHIFSEMLFSNSDPHKVVISDVGIVYNTFGKGKKEVAVITDLTKRTDYIITNIDDLKWISGFNKRLKS